MYVFALSNFISPQAQKDDVIKAVGRAIDTGFRHIDSAMFFDNEQEVGQAIAAGLKRNNLKREDLFITSKAMRISN